MSEYLTGEKEKTINITLINDSVYEGDETFDLSILAEDSPADLQTATVTITDNEDSK